MARDFIAASAQYLSRAVIINGEPCTFAVTFKPDLTDSRMLVGEFGTGATSPYRAIYVNGTGVAAEAYDGVSTVGNSSRAHGGAGVLSRACGVFASSTSRTLYVNGQAATTSTASVSVPSLSTFTVGRIDRATPIWYFDGIIAEVAAWAAALTADEALAYTKGFDPRMIRPQSLVAYYLITGNESPELDRWKNRYDLTVNNAPAKAEHPPMIYAS